jgi:hypothetical protein
MSEQDFLLHEGNLKTKKEVLETLKNDIAKKEKLLANPITAKLPDKGERIRASLAKLKKQLYYLSPSDTPGLLASEIEVEQSKSDSENPQEKDEEALGRVYKQLAHLSLAAAELESSSSQKPVQKEENQRVGRYNPPVTGHRLVELDPETTLKWNQERLERKRVSRIN